MLSTSRVRPASSAPALLAALAVFLGVALGIILHPFAAGTATAAPIRSVEDDGGTAKLQADLTAASQGYLEAKSTLDTSVQRQTELTAKIAQTEQQITQRTAQARDIAVIAFRTGGLNTTAALVDSGSPQQFFDQISVISAIATRNETHLHELAQLKRDLAVATKSAAEELATQRLQVDQMTRRKQEAEKALASAGGGQVATGPASGGTPAATPVPRRPDGSLPAEGCTVNDPTTSGCITARTLHAMQQVRAAGFTRYVSCYRPGGTGEHPKGRACDFASAANGFAGVATGADRAYGDRVAAYLVRNADPLGVLYVIWFKQIWMPSTGWRTYTRGQGDPSSDHTNHIHLSVR